MYPNIEAKVALAKCQKNNKTYGVRMEKTLMGWKYDWAFELSDSRAKSEGYGNTKMQGHIYPDAEYPGCPYCEAMAFIVCGGCGRLNCKTGNEGKVFTCNWCGGQGELGDYDGEGITSSGDV